MSLLATEGLQITEFTVQEKRVRGVDDRPGDMARGLISKNVLINCFCGNEKYHTDAVLKQDHTMTVDFCSNFRCPKAVDQGYRGDKVEGVASDAAVQGSDFFY